MRRLFLVFGCLVLVLGVAACGLGTRKAKERVKAVFDGLQHDAGGAGGFAQSAAAHWALGREVMSDQDALAKADVDFRVWAEEKGLYRRIGSYEIVDAKPDGGMMSDHAIVTVNVEGKTYRIRVPNGGPMSWVD